jgi:cyclopropane fatty-acyl-phospholipid synthase-like methyltransferase
VSDSGADARYSALHKLDSPASRLIRDTIWSREDDIGQQSFITPRYIDGLITRLGIDSGSRVLDVGSGVGGPAIYIAQAAGCQVSGIEINQVGVEVAQELAASSGLGDRVSFHLADAMEMPLDDGAVDVAVSLNVMNVFEDKVKLFTEVRRVVEPGGIWAFLSGTFDGLTKLDRAGLSRNGLVPIHYDSLGGYRAKLQTAGFRIEEITEYVADFGVQLRRWAEAYRTHLDQIADEQGEKAAELHLGYFDTYVRLIDEGKAANHLVISRRPTGA